MTNAITAFSDNSGSNSGGGGSYSTLYKITVEPTTNGKVTVSSATVRKGTSVTITSTPDEGYRVADVKVNGVSYGKGNVITVPSVNENLTIEVVFKEKWDCPFADVNEEDWFYDTVERAYKQGLMNGVSDTLFAPDGNITRGMFVTVLYRMDGEPTASEPNFVDVPVNEYYANAVSWANANGIVYGVSETEYAPNDNITREQMAAILHRYAKYKGYDVSVGEDTNILSYKDFDKLSEYAIASMQYAVGSGLIKGRTESTLNPQDNATRAEAATILIRFIDANVK